jgi:hypothetical protein
VADIRFRPSDSWLLWAIAVSSKEAPAPLSDVIFAADAVNHAIMTFEEFDSALAKLIAADAVSVTAGKLQLTDRMNTLFKESFAKRRTLMDQWDAISEYLQVKEGDWSPQWKDPLWSNSFFSRADFDAAVEEYLGRFRR